MDEKNITKATDKVLDLLKSENLTCDDVLRCMEKCHDTVNKMLTKKYFDYVKHQSFKFFFENCQHEEELKSMVLEWDENSPMTKEYALAVIQQLKLFSKRLYNFPEKEPYNGNVDFEAHMRELDGLEHYVENGSIGCE